jgi:hypothetical protein
MKTKHFTWSRRTCVIYMSDCKMFYILQVEYDERGLNFQSSTVQIGPEEISLQTEVLYSIASKYSACRGCQVVGAKQLQ